RRAVIADAGHVLISADYSQIEFRVLAHLSEDPVLLEAFSEGADFHEQTAVKIFGADSGRDPHQLRSIAKMVNYALLYGKSAYTLSKDIGVTQKAAQEFIDAYFAGFPRGGRRNGRRGADTHAGRRAAQGAAHGRRRHRRKRERGQVVNREVVNRESGIGNRESGIGNRVIE